MDKCPKDESTIKNLVCEKSSSHSREKLEKPVGGWHPRPPGHQKVNMSTLVVDADCEARTCNPSIINLYFSDEKSTTVEN